MAEAALPSSPPGHGQSVWVEATTDSSAQTPVLPLLRALPGGHRPRFLRPQDTAANRPPGEAHCDTVFTANHVTAAARWAATITVTASANGEAAASGITGSSATATATRATVRYRRTASDLRRKRRGQPRTVPSARPRRAAIWRWPIPRAAVSSRPPITSAHPSAAARPPPAADMRDLTTVQCERRGCTTVGIRDHHGPPVADRAPAARARPHKGDTSVRRPAVGVPGSGRASRRPSRRSRRPPPPSGRARPGPPPPRPPWPRTARTASGCPLHRRRTSAHNWRRQGARPRARPSSARPRGAAAPGTPPAVLAPALPGGRGRRPGDRRPRRPAPARCRKQAANRPPHRNHRQADHAHRPPRSPDRLVRPPQLHVRRAHPSLERRTGLPHPDQAAESLRHLPNARTEPKPPRGSPVSSYEAPGGSPVSSHRRW